MKRTILKISLNTSNTLINEHEIANQLLKKKWKKWTIQTNLTKYIPIPTNAIIIINEKNLYKHNRKFVLIMAKRIRDLINTRQYNSNVEYEVGIYSITCIDC